MVRQSDDKNKNKDNQKEKEKDRDYSNSSQYIVESIIDKVISHSFRKYWMENLFI